MKKREKRELCLNRVEGEATLYKAEYDTNKQIDIRKLLQLLKVWPITVSKFKTNFNFDHHDLKQMFRNFEF